MTGTSRGGLVQAEDRGFWSIRYAQGSAGTMALGPEGRRLLDDCKRRGSGVAW